MTLKVLIGCERSGVVREAFRKLGHDAYSCDLVPADDGSEFHYTCDVRFVLDRGWNIALFHPPCTYLAGSAEWAYGDGPYHQKVNPNKLYGAARRQAREESIEFCKELMAAPIKHKALENPVGCLSSRMRKMDQKIQPYEFGDDASKGTCLWLENLPLLVGTKYIKPRLVCDECKGRNDYDAAFGKGCKICGAEASRLKPRWGNQTDSGQNKLSPSEDRAVKRSETYPGIARALAEQWSSYVTQLAVS